MGMPCLLLLHQDGCDVLSYNQSLTTMAATAAEITGRITFIKGEIERALQRCQNAPYPSYERTNRIQEIRQEAAAVSERAAAEIRRLEGPVREGIDQLMKEVGQKQAELTEINRRAQDALQVFQARKNEHDGRVRDAATNPLEQARLNKEWDSVSRDFQNAQAKVNRERAELQAEINTLNARKQEEQAKLSGETAKAMRSPASVALAEADAEIQVVLDRAGLLEREIATDANIELVQKATAAFHAKTEDFADAEKHHRNQARFMFVAMFVVLVASAVAIYFLFISPRVFALQPIYHEAGLSAVADTGSPQPSATAINIERVVVLATGRIAILLFLAWTVKYLADLHRAHSEQAIIYRDRRAALGVAEVILNATPELEQKRSMLQNLTDVYLNFENSAFVARRPKTPTPRSEPTLDAQLKQIKDVVGAVEPILDVVGKAAGKR